MIYIGVNFIATYKKDLPNDIKQNYNFIQITDACGWKVYIRQDLKHICIRKYGGFIGVAIGDLCPNEYIPYPHSSAEPDMVYIWLYKNGRFDIRTFTTKRQLLDVRYGNNTLAIYTSLAYK